MDGTAICFRRSCAAILLFALASFHLYGQDYPIGFEPEDYTEFVANYSQPVPDAAADADTIAGLSQRIAALEAALQASQQAAISVKKSAASRPSVNVGGRIQMDAAMFNQDDTSMAQFGDTPNGVVLRRARIAAFGDLFETASYLIEVDFAPRDSDTPINTNGQSTSLKDVYFQFRDMPVVNILRVGHVKEPFGLEQLTSDNYTTFLERSVADEGAFVPGRNNGVMIANWTENQRATWAAGVFTNATNIDQPPSFHYDNGGLAGTGRVTWAPWYDEESNGRGVLHTGVAYSYRDAPGERAVFTSRPECSLAPRDVVLVLDEVDHWEVLGAEAAMVYGPLSLQSEFFAMQVNRNTDDPLNFTGMYAYASYFLTGEHRPYNRKNGVFDRVRPWENFFCVRTDDGCVGTGRGAWELAYRFSYIDMLDDLTVKGAGSAVDNTIGLNWYLNPHARLMWDYVWSVDTYNVANGNRISDGQMQIFEMRLAVDF